MTQKFRRDGLFFTQLDNLCIGKLRSGKNKYHYVPYTIRTLIEQKLQYAPIVFQTGRVPCIQAYWANPNEFILVLDVSGQHRELGIFYQNIEDLILDKVSEYSNDYFGHHYDRHQLQDSMTPIVKTSRRLLSPVVTFSVNCQNGEPIPEFVNQYRRRILPGDMFTPVDVDVQVLFHGVKFQTDRFGPLFEVQSVKVYSGKQREYHENNVQFKPVEPTFHFNLEKQYTTHEDPLQEQPIQEEQPVQEEPIQEEPVQEEPVQEEPVQEEPVQEEPVQEQPVQEQPVQEEPVQEQPVQEQSVQEEPVQEEPVQEQPVQEESVQEEEPVEGVKEPVEVEVLMGEGEVNGETRDEEEHVREEMRNRLIVSDPSWFEPQVKTITPKNKNKKQIKTARKIKRVITRQGEKKW